MVCIPSNPDFEAWVTCDGARVVDPGEEHSTVDAGEAVDFQHASTNVGQ